MGNKQLWIWIDFFAQKVLVNKLLVAQKMLGSKFLVAEVILNNNPSVRVCPQ